MTLRAQQRVSVCVANFNGQDVIRRCLDSILSQCTDAPIEIIVHDDASSDDSVEIIRADYPQVTLLVSEENVGFCRSNNKMAQVAQGDYLLLLNNDAWLAQDAIDKLLEAAATRPGSILTLPQFSSVDSSLLDCGMWLDIFNNPVPVTRQREQAVATVMGACLWVPVSLWHRANGFPEWFESIGEDLYLCQFARITGHGVHALGESAYFHDVGGSFGGGKVVDDGLVTTLRRRRLSERNKLYVMILFHPGVLLLPVLPVHVFALLVEGLFIAAVKRDWRILRDVYLNAVSSCFANRSLLRRERARIQAQREIGVQEFLAVVRWFPYKLHMLFKYGVPRVD